MADVSQRMPRRGMSFPFFLTLVLFAALLADRYLLRGAVPDPSGNAYRLIGVVAAGLLLWLWVLVTARRHSKRFDGPIQDARGTNGALQPILATIMIVVGANLAYNHTIPKWTDTVAADSSRDVKSGTSPILDASDEQPLTPEDEELMPNAEQLLDAITGAGEERRSTDKTGRAQRGALQ